MTDTTSWWWYIGFFVVTVYLLYAYRDVIGIKFAIVATCVVSVVFTWYGTRQYYAGGPSESENQAVMRSLRDAKESCEGQLATVANARIWAYPDASVERRGAPR